MPFICQQCQRTFTLAYYRSSRRPPKYCSRSCQAIGWSERAKARTLEHAWSLVSICPHGLDCPYCCWEWQGNVDGYGYGRWMLRNVSYDAHRLTWELWHKQTIPPGIVIAHYCHNPSCCSPMHTHATTQRGNVEDSMRDGRWPHGSQRSYAKLTEADIPTIFALRLGGMTQDALAQRFGVTRGTIRDVLRRRTWKRVHISIP